MLLQSKINRVRFCYADNEAISVFAMGAATSTSTRSMERATPRNFLPAPLCSEMSQRGNNTHAPIAVLPGGECEFSGQLKQEPTAEAARVVEYVPAPQSTQELAAVAPVVARYLPAPQSTQELATEAPGVSEYLPAPQSVHAAEPIASLCFPAAHSEHVSPSAPVYPALH